LIYGFIQFHVRHLLTQHFIGVNFNFAANTSRSQYINGYSFSNGTSWSCPSGIMCLNIG